jgi:uncharacterized protein involved in exopolysaccharide biosynthesis
VSPSRKTYPADDDIDLATLGAALWRAKGWILGLVIGVGLITFVGLSMMRPLYTSEARILIQNEDFVFTRPTGDQGRSEPRSSLDEQAVQSQVQVLTSRDLILQVVKDLVGTQGQQRPSTRRTAFAWVPAGRSSAAAPRWKPRTRGCSTVRSTARG